MRRARGWCLHALLLANLPGGAHTACHDACGDELFEICQQAGLRVTEEPRHLFNAVLPPSVLLGLDKPGVVPDGVLDVALPPLLARGALNRARKEDRLPSRVLLFDVKCVFNGGPAYRSARARDEQCGAVEQRAWEVHGEYEQHARTCSRPCPQPGRLVACAHAPPQFHPGSRACLWQLRRSEL